jgi:hypothetical protein
MTIPTKHGALSSGALAPGAGTPHGAPTMGDLFKRAASGVETYVPSAVMRPDWYDAAVIHPRPYISVLLWFPQLEHSVPVMCGYWTGERYHGCGLHPESQEQPSHWAPAPAGPEQKAGGRGTR